MGAAVGRETVTAKPKGRTVSVLAVDPGSTSGLVVVSVQASWVRGSGPATWAGLGAAIATKVGYQIGRQPRSFDPMEGYTAPPRDIIHDDELLPVLAGQPLLDGSRTVRNDRFAALMAGERVFSGPALSLIDAGEVAQLRQIAGLLSNFSTAALVIEDFTLRTAVRSREVTSPDRLRLAVTAHEALIGEGRTPFLQQPAYAKTTATDDRLKAAGLHFPGSPHINDAARHALVFLRDARQKEAIRAAAWPNHFSDDFDAV
jgi:hypothetical protein